MHQQAPLSRTTRRTALAAIAAWGASPLIGAQAQERKFPSKPVTIVVPYSAGGGTDIVGRLMAQRLSEVWGQSVVVDNRTGANGVIGSSYVAKAAPDGHTLLLVVGSHAINPVLMKSLPYDTAKAFTPVTNIANSPMVLVVAADGPYKQLPDLLKVARDKEVAVGYSEGQTRLTGELIRQSGNLQITGVPYKGGAPIMVDIIGGHLPAGVTSVLTALPHIHAQLARGHDLQGGGPGRRAVAQLVRHVRPRRPARRGGRAHQPGPAQGGGRPGRDQADAGPGRQHRAHAARGVPPLRGGRNPQVGPGGPARRDQRRVRPIRHVPTPRATRAQCTLVSNTSGDKT